MTDNILTTSQEYYKTIEITYTPKWRQLKPGTKNVSIYGAKGGLNSWCNLTEEECWILASMLMEDIDIS